MDARGIIARLRGGKPLSKEELDWFAVGLAKGDVSDAQAGAFAMAACLNGLGEQGRIALTEAMRDSGDVLTWDLPGPVIDKHSTGGVGDCVSLVLAPALAACGAFVPMISGRGLGHTGGTLDKLESIPGLRTEVAERKFRSIVSDTGCAIVSATGDIAPADKRLYAVRDVTATVDSVDLITASILSKKLAAGLDALILDVKLGSGAFMKTRDEARELAEALVTTANGAGCKTIAMITDMSQPLASAAGNALEVAACMDVLCDGAETPLLQLTAALGGALLRRAGLAEDDAIGRSMIRASISAGDAAERFGKMVAALGGPPDFLHDWRTHLPRAKFELPVLAENTGYVTEIDAEILGRIVVHLGGGRLVGGQKINPAVGLENIVRLGQPVERGQPLAVVHANDAQAAREASAALREVVMLSSRPQTPPDLLVESVEA